MPMVLPPSAEVEPIDDAILCQMYRQTGKWKPGSKIIIPETGREEIFFAQVISVGEGKIVDFNEDGTPFRKPMGVEEEDWIVFARYHGERLQVADELYLLLREGDVLAKIDMGEDAEEYLVPWRLGSSEGEDDAPLAKAQVQE